MFVGTIVNVLTILVGSIIGIIFKKSIPERITKIIFDSLGLCTIVISLGMILKAENMILIIFSILLGALTGEILKIQEFFDSLGEKLKNFIKSKDESFTEGFVGAFLIFCIGAMTITGCFDEGIRGNSTILITKAILDGFCSIALASTLGIGVAFSIIPLFIFQVSLTLLSRWIEPLLNSFIINQVIATGGILVLAIGFNLLNIKKIKVSNLLPALVYIIILSIIFMKVFKYE